MKRMPSPSIFALVPLIVGLMVFLGCEGDEGPTGPQGPQGPEGPQGPPGTLSEYTYIGGAGEDCMHCHATTVNTVLLTNHDQATADLSEESQKNLYCMQCHTTGFDSEVANGDTTIASGNYGPDLNGYDDYVGVDTEEAAERRAALEGVQCESCHGPMGPEFNMNQPAISFATRQEDGEWLALCDPCHEGQLEEWVESGHGTVTQTIEEFNEEHYVGNPSCDGCHTSEGFIRDNDPALANYEFSEPYSFIGCVTCHDPHVGESGGGNVAQLRNLSAVEVLYAPGFSPGDPDIPKMEGYGTAQTCAQCHHGRRDTDHVEGQIEEGYAHFGPHGSPQMDMFVGAGCYELDGYTYDDRHSHQGVETACVYCHMVREVELHGELQDHAFHNFNPDVGNCEPCHQNLPDFNYNNLQTDVMDKMDELAQALGYDDAEAFLDEDTGWDSQAVDVEVWEREAAYALVFVNNDGSKGVHNPDYALDLLNNAINYANAQGGGKFAAK